MTVGKDTGRTKFRGINTGADKTQWGKDRGLKSVEVKKLRGEKTREENTGRKKAGRGVGCDYRDKTRGESTGHGYVTTGTI